VSLEKGSGDLTTSRTNEEAGTVVQDIYSSSILDALQEICAELRLTNELLKGILQ